MKYCKQVTSVSTMLSLNGMTTRNKTGARSNKYQDYERWEDLQASGELFTYFLKAICGIYGLKVEMSTIGTLRSRNLLPAIKAMIAVWPVSAQVEHYPRCLQNGQLVARPDEKLIKQIIDGSCGTVCLLNIIHQLGLVSKFDGTNYLIEAIRNSESNVRAGQIVCNQQNVKKWHQTALKACRVNDDVRIARHLNMEFDTWIDEETGDIESFPVSVAQQPQSPRNHIVAFVPQGNTPLLFDGLQDVAYALEGFDYDNWFDKVMHFAHDIESLGRGEVTMFVVTEFNEGENVVEIGLMDTSKLGNCVNNPNKQVENNQPGDEEALKMAQPSIDKSAFPNSEVTEKSASPNNEVTEKSVSSNSEVTEKSVEKTENSVQSNSEETEKLTAVLPNVAKSQRKTLRIASKSDRCGEAMQTRSSKQGINLFPAMFEENQSELEAIWVGFPANYTPADNEKALILTYDCKILCRYVKRGKWKYSIQWVGYDNEVQHDFSEKAILTRAESDQLFASLRSTVNIADNTGARYPVRAKNSRWWHLPGLKSILENRQRLQIEQQKKLNQSANCETGKDKQDVNAKSSCENVSGENESEESISSGNMKASSEISQCSSGVVNGAKQAEKSTSQPKAIADSSKTDGNVVSMTTRSGNKTNLSNANGTEKVENQGTVLRKSNRLAGSKQVPVNMNNPAKRKNDDQDKSITSCSKRVKISKPRATTTKQ